MEKELFQAIAMSVDGDGGFLDFGLFASLEEATTALRRYAVYEVCIDGGYTDALTEFPWGDAHDLEAADRWMAQLSPQELASWARVSMADRLVVLRRIVRSHGALDEESLSAGYPVEMRGDLQRVGDEWEYKDILRIL